MDDETPVLDFTLKEDLPSQYCKCYQAANGSIFYHSYSTPGSLHVITPDGTRVDSDLQNLEGMDFLDIHVNANSLYFTMLDYVDKEKEHWSRRIFEVHADKDRIVWNVVIGIPFDEEWQSSPCGEYFVETKGDLVILRDLHGGLLARSITKPEKYDGHMVFFRESLFIVINGPKISATRINSDIVVVEMPFNVLVDRLDIHVYSDSSDVHFVNTGHDLLVSVNAADLSYRVWKFNRPSSCSFHTFDYSVGVRSGVLTLRLRDEKAETAQLWTSQIE